MTSCIIWLHTKQSYQGIVCKYDGGISEVGMKLQIFYNTLEKVQELINLGHLDSLGIVIGRKISLQKSLENTHYYEKIQHQCIAYARDGGKTLEILKATNEKELVDISTKYDYAYLWSRNKWFVSSRTKEFKPLDVEINKEIKKYAKTLGHDLTQEDLRDRYDAFVYKDRVPEQVKKNIEVFEKYILKEYNSSNSLYDFVVIRKEKQNYIIKTIKTGQIQTVTYDVLKQQLQAGIKIGKKYGNSIRAFSLKERK